jgi:hypothetical protein
LSLAEFVWYWLILIDVGGSEGEEKEFIEEGDVFIATNSNCDGNHANELSIHERKWLQL